MQKSDKLYLTRLEFDPDLFNENDMVEYIGFSGDWYSADFPEEDESFWVDEDWDEYI